LLDIELKGTSTFEYAQDAARRLNEVSLQPAARDRLIAVSREALHPSAVQALSERLPTALTITRQLPDSWIDEAWRRAILAAVDALFHDGRDWLRIVALRSLHRFRADWSDRTLAVLLNDPEPSVWHCAKELLGEPGKEQLTGLFQRALGEGDSRAAFALGRRIKALFNSERCDAMRELAHQLLSTGSGASKQAALPASAALYSPYQRGSTPLPSGESIRAVFQECGIEETWRAYAVDAQQFGDDERKFTYYIFDAFKEDRDSLHRIVTLARELWPDDLRCTAEHILLLIDAGDRDRVAEALGAAELRFKDSISHRWLGERYSQIGRSQEALEHYRIGADESPRDAVCHLLLGWAEFVHGNWVASISATRRGLELDATNTGGHFNLGVALIANGDLSAAPAVYQRGLALARRHASADALKMLTEAIEDLERFSAQPHLEATIRVIGEVLRAEHDRLAVA
jgi:tetratricopeptide (TPR) repeat protein